MFAEFLRAKIAAIDTILLPPCHSRQLSVQSYASRRRRRC